MEFARERDRERGIEREEGNVREKSQGYAKLFKILWSFLFGLKVKHTNLRKNRKGNLPEGARGIPGSVE